MLDVFKHPYWLFEISKLAFIDEEVLDHADGLAPVQREERMLAFWLLFLEADIEVALQVQETVLLVEGGQQLDYILL